MFIAQNMSSFMELCNIQAVIVETNSKLGKLNSEEQKHHKIIHTIMTMHRINHME